MEDSAVVALNPLFTVAANEQHGLQIKLQKLTPQDNPADFSRWALPERLALVDRIQAAFDASVRGAESGRQVSALRAAAQSYLELPSDERHTGNQLMPSQTKSHLHQLASLALVADALFLGCLFRRLARTPVVIRGSRILHRAAGEGEGELFGTFIQAAPASSTGYYAHK
jgi:hypothetical protein